MQPYRTELSRSTAAMNNTNQKSTSYFIAEEVLPVVPMAGIGACMRCAYRVSVHSPTKMRAIKMQRRPTLRPPNIFAICLLFAALIPCVRCVDASVSPYTITFSAQTSANMTQDMMDAKMEKRRKGVYGPPAGKQFVVHVDDLNMPKR